MAAITSASWSPLLAQCDASAEARLAFANGCTPDELAQLYADAQRMQHLLGQVVLPMIDRTARARWLDHGSDAFAVAYRALDTCFDGTAPVLPEFTADGYHAKIEEQRRALENAQIALRREQELVEARWKTLVRVLRTEFGSRVDTIVKQFIKREQRALKRGILRVEP